MHTFNEDIQHFHILSIQKNKNTTWEIGFPLDFFPLGDPNLGLVLGIRFVTWNKNREWFYSDNFCITVIEYLFMVFRVSNFHIRFVIMPNKILEKQNMQQKYVQIWCLSFSGPGYAILPIFYGPYYIGHIIWLCSTLGLNLKNFLRWTHEGSDLFSYFQADAIGYLWTQLLHY